jgi:hypothetical protein
MNAAESATGPGSCISVVIMLMPIYLHYAKVRCFAPRDVWVGLAIIFILSGSSSRAEPKESDDEHRYMAASSKIKLGDTEQQVTQKIEPLWTRGAPTNRFLGTYPFKGMIPCTNASVVSEWRAKSSGGRWPSVLFVVFSDSSKTNTVDVLQSDGTSVLPLVEGEYHRNLLRIRTGDSIDTVYRLLGRMDCEYTRGVDGKWRAKFIYRGARGEYICIEADAGSGVVLKVADVTI